MTNTANQFVANPPVGAPDYAWQRGTPSWQAGFLHTYPITMTLGFILAFLSIVYFWKRQKYSWEVLQVMLIIIIPCSLVGARLWFLISEGRADDWKHFYKMSGLAIHGGVMGAMLGVIPYLLTKKDLVDVRVAFTIVVPNVIMGQAIGRWGNFANHEVFGRAIEGSSLDWMGSLKDHMYIKSYIDPVDVQHLHDTGEWAAYSDPTKLTYSGNYTYAYRIPLFFIESMTSLLGYIIMTWILIRKNWLRPGVVGALYFVWYGVVRASMEPLRDPVDIMTWGDTFQASTFTALTQLTVGVMLMLYWQFFDNKTVNNYLYRRIFKKDNTYKGQDWSNKTIRLACADIRKETDKYEMIKPVKERKKWFFGKRSDKRKQYLFFGKEIDNYVRIWTLSENHESWSKRELNANKKNKKKKNE